MTKDLTRKPSLGSDADGDDSISGQSSIQEASSTNSTKDASNHSEESNQVKFVQRETSYVLRLRAAVVLALLAAAVSVSTLVFKITNKSEVDTFESNYEAAAEKVTGE